MAVKAVVCLGNPGPEYSTTRHNVGWWLADRLLQEWGFGRFRKEGQAAVAMGRVDGVQVQLMKPLAYMNRSGVAVTPLRRVKEFDLARDLLVIVDEVALEPGRARFRPSGSAGGHNGLKSIEAALGTRDYGRLRIGVGAKPAQWDLADWVLGTPSRDDRQAILDILPDLVEGVGVWVREGMEAAMNRYNGIGGGAAREGT